MDQGGVASNTKRTKQEAELEWMNSKVTHSYHLQSIDKLRIWLPMSLFFFISPSNPTNSTWL